MDIKFTFEDGGEFLAHYGKAGMRWRKGRKTPIKPVSQGVRGSQSMQNTSSGSSSGTSKSPKTIKALAKSITGIAKQAKIEKKYGLKKRKLKLSSKAGLTAKYAAKVASANAKHESIEQRRKTRKLSGYSGLHTNG